jgi:DNA modification methylase
MKEQLPHKTTPAFVYRKAKLYHEDCFTWLQRRRRSSIHGVVTDPPYGLVEYTATELTKLRNGHGVGVWRLPPNFDGYERAPLPRFTELSDKDIERLYEYFQEWGRLLLPVLVPGAYVMVASNPLLEHMLLHALHSVGFERRGQIIRLVHTMRGGDRPKYAHEEFPGVSVMPRSMHEPWVLFRKPVEQTVRENLRQWKTGALRRPSDAQPFTDVIRASPATRAERRIATHPSLKPQTFLRQVVHAILPLGAGVVLDPFAGSGSTLAAAQAIGYRSIGVEIDADYVKTAKEAIPALARFQPSSSGQRLSGGGLTTSNEGPKPLVRERDSLRLSKT